MIFYIFSVIVSVLTLVLTITLTFTEQENSVLHKFFGYNEIYFFIALSVALLIFGWIWEGKKEDTDGIYR